MIEYFKAAVTGVVEGVTEFLPISSTGHLIVTNHLLNFTPSPAYDVIIQGAAILALLWFYRAELATHIKNLQAYVQKEGLAALSPKALNTARVDLPEDAQHRKELASATLFVSVALAFLPFAVMGFLFGDFIETRLFNTSVVATGLIVGGILMLLLEEHRPTVKTEDLSGLTIGQAVLTGLMQLLAMFPGMSRASSSIMGGMVVGLSRKAATEFSFYLGIPTILGSTLYSLVKHGGELMQENLGVMALGLVTSFCVAWLTIAWLLNYISKNDFVPFAWYRISLGIFIFILF